MAAKSTSTSVRRTRKSKAVSAPLPVHLTPEMIEHHARKEALREIQHIIDNWTDAERKIIGHVCPYGDPVAGIKEIRRLLGESIAKCKVIPFPIDRRLAAKEV
jgi:hypothetical protein